jgi:hypothetical protein
VIGLILIVSGRATKSSARLDGLSLPHVFDVLSAKVECLTRDQRMPMLNWHLLADEADPAPCYKDRSGEANRASLRAQRRTRTGDPFLTMEVLYQLS